MLILRPEQNYFQGAEAVQDGLDFRPGCIREAPAENRSLARRTAKSEPPAGLLQTPRQFFQCFVHRGQAVTLVKLVEFVQMNGGQAQRRVQALGAAQSLSQSCGSMKVRVYRPVTGSVVEEPPNGLADASPAGFSTVKCFR